MTAEPRPKLEETHAMFTSPFHGYYHRRTTRSRPSGSRFLGYANTRSLAFAMFVALALLSNTRGKDAGPGRLSAPRAAKNEIAIHPQTTAKVTVR
jgi:hypothetical protein